MIRELEQDLGVRRPRAPHRSYAPRVTALEERGEPGDAALHGLLVDDVGAFETRERIRVAGVLDLHREDRTIGRALVASDLPGEGAGVGAARHHVHDVLDGAGGVPREREDRQRADHHGGGHHADHDLPSLGQCHG